MPKLYDDLILLLEAIKRYEPLRQYYDHPSLVHRPPSYAHDTNQLRYIIDKIETSILKNEYKEYKDIK